jgi:hypothetical protein
MNDASDRKLTSMTAQIGNVRKKKDKPTVRKKVWHSIGVLQIAVSKH